jgi:4-diphosphocytidyl-2-C-methyl-D-erythritol kinase
MVVFPNAKINLGLNIIQKRSDGYHDLETIFYPVMIKDALEIIQHNTDCDISGIQSNELQIEFTCSGLSVEGDQNSNLCVKAYHLLKKDFPKLPAIKMHLHKHIPMGAGLGGGSADGAFTLKLLNQKFNLNLSQQQLIDYALQLGSDCPFFIINQPCFATSRGEIMEPIQLDLSAYTFIIVNPGIHVATGWAFSQITPTMPKVSIKEIIKQPIATWKDALKNDFEEAVLQAHPAIKKIKDRLYNAGAVYASMSGSGSTVYGIFEKQIQPIIDFPADYFLQIL